MMYLDTHAVVWLYAGLLSKFSKRGIALLETEDLRISPMVMLEIEYLYEIGRIKETASNIYHYLSERIDLRQCGLPFSNVIRFAIHENWTRDPFDRIIIAQARVNEAKLLTKDEALTHHYKRTIWD